MSASSLVSFITGGASGIGLALSRALVSMGERVVLTDIAESKGQVEANTLSGIGPGEARFVALDVRDPIAFRQAIEDVISNWGGLYRLFNNAGVVYYKPATAHTPEEWKRTLDVNIGGVINGCRAVMPFFRDRSEGHIINTASFAGLVPMPQYPVYGMTKFGIVGLSLNLRAEWRHLGIRVSVLCPGAISTPMFDAQKNSLNTMDAFILNLLKMKADKFAQKALKAINHNQAIIILPRLFRPIWWLSRLFPTIGTFLFYRRTTSFE